MPIKVNFEISDRQVSIGKKVVLWLAFLYSVYFCYRYSRGDGAFNALWALPIWGAILLRGVVVFTVSFLALKIIPQKYYRETAPFIPFAPAIFMSGILTFSELAEHEAASAVHIFAWLSPLIFAVILCIFTVHFLKRANSRNNTI